MSAGSSPSNIIYEKGMNRKFIIIISLLFCLFLAGQIRASAPQDSLGALASKISSLPDQEIFVYKAKFWGLSIGSFIIMNTGKTMLNGREVYRYELTVRTLPVFSLLFKTKSRYVSYMDIQDFVVLRHEEYIKGGTLLESVVNFDYKNLTATYTDFINHQEHTVKIPDKILDALSGSFYLRMMALEPGDTVDLPIYADQKIYHYKGVLSSIAKIKVPKLGKQEVYYFKPYLFIDGKEITKISAEVYYSITIPAKTLRATLNTPLGDVNVVLIEDYENSLVKSRSF